MKHLIKRNLLIFFRDKSSVFFSLLSVFIIIGVYVLFLGDVLAESVEGVKGVRFLMDSWIMAGLLAVTPATTVLGAMGTMIEDKQYKQYKDFSASPVKRASLACGYIISGFIVSLILTLITFILAEGYVVLNGGEVLEFSAILKVIGLILLNVLSSSFLMFYMVSFFKSTGAFSTASTIIGTLIGFLTGVYIPIGNLPEAVQTVIKVIPTSHAGVLFRQVMMEQAENITFAGAPAETVSGFHQSLGVTFLLGKEEISAAASIFYMIAVTAVFFLLSILRINKKEK